MKIRSISILLTLVFVLALLSCQPATEELPDESTTDGGETEHVCAVSQLQDVPGEHAAVCTVCNKKHLKPEACSFFRENCKDTCVTCTVCGAWQIVESEEHDWKTEWVSGCWYSNEVSTCKKCGETETIHGSPALPNHIWAEIASDGGLTTFKCTRCSESNIFISEIGEFSYAEVLEEYKIGDPGVMHEGFHFSHTFDQVDDANEAVARAKLEIDSHYTVEYDMISVSYDTESGTWRVDFFALNAPGGGYSVYMRRTGEMCYIVCGE